MRFVNVGHRVVARRAERSSQGESDVGPGIIAHAGLSLSSRSESGVAAEE
jgi:hypothetical protein